VFLQLPQKYNCDMRIEQIKMPKVDSPTNRH